MILLWEKTLYINLHSTSLPKGFEVVYKRIYIHNSVKEGKSDEKKNVGQLIR